MIFFIFYTSLSYNKKCAAEAAHEKRTAPFAATQTFTFTEGMRKRACIFTEIKIHTFRKFYSVCVARIFYTNLQEIAIVISRPICPAFPGSGSYKARHCHPTGARMKSLLSQGINLLCR
jgi:hypothetical protein